MRADYQPNEATSIRDVSDRPGLGNNGVRHSKSFNTTLDKCYDLDDNDFDDAIGEELNLETNDATESSHNNNYIGGRRKRLDSWYSANSYKSTYFSTAESLYQSIDDNMSTYGSEFSPENNKQTQMYGPAATAPALMADVPADWVVETGDFVMVHAVYQPYIGSDCFIAPQSKLNDGVIWLVVIRSGASRQDLFKFLIGLSSGTHVPEQRNEFIKMIPVTAFRIEPTGTQGKMTVDGEAVEYGPIQAEIFPGLAAVLAPQSS